MPRRSPGVVSWMLAILGWLTATPGSPARAAEQASASPTFAAGEIEALVAPIALYPDSLLAQVLMASTYPLEVVEAARFAEQHPDLAGDALDQALQDETWDASVKSLVSFPQALEMLNEKIDWTQKLGDAFLAQQSDVMDAVQRLRAKAKQEGNLESNEQQKVIVQQAPAPPPEVVVQQAPPSKTVIVIEPAAPQVVYVPTYNPTVVYGAWVYPAYPPYYYYPPGYVVGASMISFGIGMAVGASLWGGCHWGWGHGDIDIDINHYNNFNKNVTRNYNKTEINNKFKNGKWQHDSSHRKGVQYRDKATQQRFDRGGRGGVDARQAFRGRAEQGRQQVAREQRKEPNTKARQQRSSGTGDRAPANTSAGSRKPSSIDRSRDSGMFQGVGQGGQVRRDANRGRASRASANHSVSRGRVPIGGGGQR